MRYATFLYQGTSRAGVIDGERVLPFPQRLSSLSDYLALPAAERAALQTGEAIPLGQVTLLAPLVPRKNVFCVGRNYLAHAEEGARAHKVGLNLPSVPTFFTKAPSAIAGDGAQLRLSSTASTKYDWEAELAVVIGQRCKDVSEADALDVVFGYTTINDISARDLQSAHQQWFKGKSLDDTCPMGPWVVSADEIPDPQALRVRLLLNGVVKQDGHTSEMIFPVRTIIASLSQGMTLEPGDVISTGTPDGVGFARTPPEFLAEGDAMEVEIERVGSLRNTVSLVP